MPDMTIKYWGVRGSIPTPLTSAQIQQKQLALIQKIIQDGGTHQLFPNNEAIKDYLKTLPLHLSGTYGGDTTCLEIQAKDSPLIIIDAGTGARLLGRALLKRLSENKNLNPLNNNQTTKKEIHLFFTHYHWDHLQGFPFFAPNFIPGDQRVTINFYGMKDTTKRLSEVLKLQQEYPSFPVIWEDMPCQKKCIELPNSPQTIKIGNLSINYQELTHPDPVYAYSFEINNKKFVFATDTENQSPDSRIIKIAQNADILYHDSQYTPQEYQGDQNTLTGAFPKSGWGHSTYQWAIQNALAANVKTLVLGHHEPLRNDFQMEKLHQKAFAFRDQQLALPQNQNKKLNIILAHQGLEQTL